MIGDPFSSCSFFSHAFPFQKDLGLMMMFMGRQRDINSNQIHSKPSLSAQPHTLPRFHNPIRPVWSFHSILTPASSSVVGSHNMHISWRKLGGNGQTLSIFCMTMYLSLSTFHFISFHSGVQIRLGEIGVKFRFWCGDEQSNWRLFHFFVFHKRNFECGDVFMSTNSNGLLTVIEFHVCSSWENEMDTFKDSAM